MILNFPENELGDGPKNSQIRVNRHHTCYLLYILKYFSTVITMFDSSINRLPNDKPVFVKVSAMKFEKRYRIRLGI